MNAVMTFIVLFLRRTFIALEMLAFHQGRCSTKLVSNGLAIRNFHSCSQLRSARHKMEIYRLLLALFLVHTAAHVQAAKPGKN